MTMKRIVFSLLGWLSRPINRLYGCVERVSARSTPLTLFSKKSHMPSKVSEKTGKTSVASVMAQLERLGSKHNRDSLARFGITGKNALGVSVADLHKVAKGLGSNHALAAELWATECYEARMLAAFVDEPDKVTAAQMQRWARDFDNWAICDTHCMHLFDRTPHAWGKVKAWSDAPQEFVRRAAFALLATLALHDKTGPDAPFVEGLVLIEKAAVDPRNFVKKAVNWALRSIGRRNQNLHRKALVVARRLSGSSEAAARFVGKGAVKELTSTPVLQKLAASPR
jgi:3-methyladenine DNA glycosylase AlkD